MRTNNFILDGGANIAFSFIFNLIVKAPTNSSVFLEFLCICFYVTCNSISIHLTNRTVHIKQNGQHSTEQFTLIRSIRIKPNSSH